MTVGFTSTASGSMPGSPVSSRLSTSSYSPTGTDVGPGLAAEFTVELRLQSTLRCHQNSVNRYSRGPAHSADRVAAADRSTG